MSSVSFVLQSVSQTLANMNCWKSLVHQSHSWAWCGWDTPQLLQSSWGHFEVPPSLLLSVIFLCCHFRYQVPPLLLVKANTSYVIYTSLNYLSWILVLMIDISRHGSQHCSHRSATQSEVTASQARLLRSSDPVSSQPEPGLQQSPSDLGQHPLSSSDPRLQWGWSSQPPVYPR